MKKQNGICNIATLFLMVSVLISNSAVSQNISSTTVESRKIMNQALKSIVGIEAQVIETEPPIQIFGEPYSTAGAQNRVFWESLPDDSFQVVINGIPTWIKSEDTDIVVWSSLDPVPDSNGVRTKGALIPGSVDTSSYLFNNIFPQDGPEANAYYNKDIYYWVTIRFQDSEGNDYSTDYTQSRKSISQQDSTKPNVNTFTAEQTAQNSKNGWFNINDPSLVFLGLTDPVAIYKSFLGMNGIDIDSINYKPVPDGSLDETKLVVADTFKRSFADGMHKVYLNASDAAHKPESHGGNLSGSIPADWQMKGNRADSLKMLTLNIDTTVPEIFFDEIDSVYSSGDEDSTGEILFQFKIYDVHSGVDLNSIILEFAPAVDTTVIIESRMDTTLISVKVQNLDDDTCTTLSVTVSDNAGNQTSSDKKICFRVEPPQITAFTIYDKELKSENCLKPIDAHTNDDTVKIRIDEYELVKDRSIMDILIEGEIGSTRKSFPPDSVLDFPLSEAVDLGERDWKDLTLFAIDSLGNIQLDGISDSIYYDDRGDPTIDSVIVRDQTPLAIDERNGAFEGYTNDDVVSVWIHTPDSLRLYRTSEKSPQVECIEPFMNQFLYPFPESIDKVWTFTYQVGDSAGNASNEQSDTITRDTEIANIDTSDFSIRLPDKISGHSVIIEFLTTDKIDDISRMIINDSVYFATADSAIVTVPIEDSLFVVSVVDFAGNESNKVNLDLPKPPFCFIPFDVSNYPNEAQPGYTNDDQVAWHFCDSLKYDTTKIVKIVFSSDTITPKMFDWDQGESKFIPLRELYPVLSTGSYNIIGYGILENGIETKKDTAKIYYKIERPIIASIALIDTSANPWEAADKYSNDRDVQLDVLASALVDSIAIWGDVDTLVTSEGYITLPDTVRYDSVMTVRVSNGFIPKIVECKVRDRAGNWMNGSIRDTINYVEPPNFLAARIDTSDNYPNMPIDDDSTGTLTVLRPDNDQIVLPIWFKCDLPEFIWKAVTTNPHMIKDTTTISLEACEEVDGGFRCHVNFIVDTLGIYTAEVGDKGGNKSKTVSIFLDVVEPPKISFTLYDRNEFPDYHSSGTVLPYDWQRSDSLFTDEATVVAVTKLRRGDWSHIRFAPTEAGLDTADYQPVANVDSTIDIREYKLPVNEDTTHYQTLYVQVKNQIDNNVDTSYTIIYDNEPPEFRSFTAPQTVLDSRLDFSYLGYDTPPGGIAGLIVREYLLELGETEADTALKFISPNDDNFIELLPPNGLRLITGILVDFAGYDQNRQDFSFISQPSETLHFQVRKNPIETSVYPNPINPYSSITENRKAKLVFYLERATTVDISIVDPFGQSVWSRSVECEPGLNDGHFNEALCWDGRNDNGDLVATGGYICIISPKGGERQYHKIAVLKSD